MIPVVEQHNDDLYLDSRVTASGHKRECGAQNR
jgi:hypothetical protein